MPGSKDGEAARPVKMLGEVDVARQFAIAFHYAPPHAGGGAFR